MTIETYLERIIPVDHTFYSFKWSLIFTTDKIPKHSKMYISCCLTIIMLLKHSWKVLYHLHTFYSFKCSVIFTTDKISKHSKMYISCCLIIIMLLKHSWKNYTIYTPFIPLNVQLSSLLTKFQNILKCIYHVA